MSLRGEGIAPGLDTFTKEAADNPAAHAQHVAQELLPLPIRPLPRGQRAPQACRIAVDRILSATRSGARRSPRADGVATPGVPCPLQQLRHERAHDVNWPLRRKAARHSGCSESHPAAPGRDLALAKSQPCAAAHERLEPHARVLQRACRTLGVRMGDDASPSRSAHKSSGPCMT